MCPPCSTNCPPALDIAGLILDRQANARWSSGEMILEESIGSVGENRECLDMCVIDCRHRSGQVARPEPRQYWESSQCASAKVARAHTSLPCMLPGRREGDVKDKDQTRVKGDGARLRIASQSHCHRVWGLLDSRIVICLVALRPV